MPANTNYITDQIITIEPKQIIIEEEEEDECDYEDYALSFAPTDSVLFSEVSFNL